MGGPDMAPHTPPTLGSAPGNPGRSSDCRAGMGPDMAPHTPPTLGSAPGNPGRSSDCRAVRSALRALWERWKRIAFWIGDKQATLIYALLYYFLIGPVALVRRWVADPLQYRARSKPSFWLPRPVTPPTLDAARRQ
jgi:hypothetical protein